MFKLIDSDMIYGKTCRVCPMSHYNIIDSESDITISTEKRCSHDIQIG